MYMCNWSGRRKGIARVEKKCWRNFKTDGGKKNHAMVAEHSTD